ncbi:hypothetical protein AMTRI_Chr03g139370 [Amborella trichopoda]
MEVRVFRVNFTGDGAARLREKVKDKLKEFMGSYTDDTLVEYVIVLLRNGRQKEEAKKELNVFLGDDSESFVSWLWDHLSSNLHLYVPPPEPSSSVEETVEPESLLDDGLRGIDQPMDQTSGDPHSYMEIEEPIMEARSRRRRQWKSSTLDTTEPSLQTNDIEKPIKQNDEHQSIYTKERTGRRSRSFKRPRSPKTRVRRDENVDDEWKPKKADSASRPSVDAPRRLLQYAVREAVGPLTSTSKSEPASKRLRSVVATSSGNTLHDAPPQRTKSVTRVPLLMASAVKAAAEAAEDVSKSRSGKNVFDRLGGAKDGIDCTEQLTVFKAPTPEELGYGAEGVNFQENHYGRDFNGEVSTFDENNVMASDYASENDGFDEVGASERRFLDASQSSGNKDNDSLLVQYSIAQNKDEGRKTKLKDQAVNGMANASQKIVNISVNVNTWKPSHFQSVRNVGGPEKRNSTLEADTGVTENAAQTCEEVKAVMAGNGNQDMSLGDTRKETQKVVQSVPGAYSAVRSFEDADSRTVFVSNVHFGATKDTLSRHFNKCGEVLKVIILSDAATGQPKGSAYVEFARKEAAELALSLNGTSFMSRILKVVRRSSGQHEALPSIWPRIHRPFSTSRFTGRAPFTRPLAPTRWSPLKTGPRSLQWKRDGPVGPQNQAPLASPLTPGPRSLTYVRSDAPTQT